MRETLKVLAYGVTFILIVLCDRITKYMALLYCQRPWHINSFFSCDLTINRGISWGFFDSQNTVAFCAVTILVGLVMAVLGWYGYTRWKQGYVVIGEVCAFAGAFSNMIDRFIYKGVIDFCIFNVQGWAPFGVFNAADVAIVAGAMLIFLTSLKD